MRVQFEYVSSLLSECVSSVSLLSLTVLVPLCSLSSHLPLSTWPDYHHVFHLTHCLRPFPQVSKPTSPPGPGCLVHTLGSLRGKWVWNPTDIGMGRALDWLWCFVYRYSLSDHRKWYKWRRHQYDISASGRRCLRSFLLQHLIILQLNEPRKTQCSFAAFNIKMLWYFCGVWRRLRDLFSFTRQSSSCFSPLLCCVCQILNSY